LFVGPDVDVRTLNTRVAGEIDGTNYGRAEIDALIDGGRRRLHLKVQFRCVEKEWIYEVAMRILA
jgi:hypothetical protein